MTPTLDVERGLLADGARWVAGMDEVGRGALAGPVSVGVLAVERTTTAAPAGVRDSKLLTSAARERLFDDVRAWGGAYAVGHASAQEIDAVGIVAALRAAGRRALAQLPIQPDAVVLDGSHDWLSDPPADLFVVDEPVPLSAQVLTMVKADQRCASVAGASILAKCTRDAFMVHLAGVDSGDCPMAQCPRCLAPERPQWGVYGWESNKGYGTADHLAAIRQYGPTAIHRRTWRLPRVDGLDRAEVDRQEPVRFAERA